MVHGKKNQERLNSQAFRKRVTALAEEGIAEAMNEVEQTVRKEITNAAAGIVPAVLGLRHSWGEYEINRTNMIDREHPLGVAYRQAAAEAATRIVTEAIKDFEPSKKMLQAIRSAYSETLMYECEERARVIAVEQADTYATEIVNKTLGEMGGTP